MHVEATDNDNTSCHGPAYNTRSCSRLKGTVDSAFSSVCERTASHQARDERNMSEATEVHDGPAYNTRSRTRRANGGCDTCEEPFVHPVSNKSEFFSHFAFLFYLRNVSWPFSAARRSRVSTAKGSRTPIPPQSRKRSARKRPNETPAHETNSALLQAPGESTSKKRVKVSTRVSRKSNGEKRAEASPQPLKKSKPKKHARVSTQPSRKSNLKKHARMSTQALKTLNAEKRAVETSPQPLKTPDFEKYAVEISPQPSKTPNVEKRTKTPPQSHASQGRPTAASAARSKTSTFKRCQCLDEKTLQMTPMEQMFSHMAATTMAPTPFSRLVCYYVFLR